MQICKGDTFIITGIDRNGRRFRRHTDSWLFAAGINVWRGTKWLVRDGKRHKICSIYN